MTILEEAMSYRFPLGLMPYGQSNPADYDAVSHWAERSVYFARMALIISGVGNNIFAPQEHFTREQSIITIMRVWSGTRLNLNSLNESR